MGAVARFFGNLRIWPGPILAVELITTSRRVRYFVLRVIYAVCLLFALWSTHEAHFRMGTGDVNATAQFCAAFFQTFGLMQLMVVLLIGPALAAGSIAQERERRTIEYLYTTPLSNLEIIIGKLGGRVLQTLYLILSGVPVLAMAMLLGGIAPRWIASLTAITLSTILSVTMIALAVSVWTTRARDAVIRAYLVFFCLWVLPLPTYFSISRSSWSWFSPVLEQLIIANPLMTFMMIVEGQGPWGPLTDPGSLLMALVRNQLLAGGIALGLATIFMRRVHVKESGKSARKPRWRIQLLRGQIGNNPMYWKEVYAASAATRLGLLGYALLALMFVGVCGFTYYIFGETVGRSWTARGEGFCEYAVTMSTFLICCGLLLLTARAAGSITSEKERDCWVSLISTPLEGEQIVRAKILGSLWTLSGLAPFVAVVWLPALVLWPPYFWGIVVSLLVLAVLSAFTATLGVYCSLRSKSTLRAMGAALGIAIVLGGDYLMCCCPIVAMGPHSSGPDDIQIGLAPCMPFLLAWPGVVSVTLQESRGNLAQSEQFAGYTTACLIGTIGYAIATVVLLVQSTAQFDDLSGRLRQRAHPPRRTNPT